MRVPLLFSLLLVLPAPAFGAVVLYGTPSAPPVHVQATPVITQLPPPPPPEAPRVTPSVSDRAVLREKPAQGYADLRQPAQSFSAQTPLYVLEDGGVNTGDAPKKKKEKSQ